MKKRVLPQFVGNVVLKISNRSLIGGHQPRADLFTLIQSLNRIWLMVAWFFMLCLVFFTFSSPVRFRIAACDVGQGDAILAQVDSLAILIDAGPNQAILRCLRQKMPLGQSKIAISAWSHWDADHIGGFSDVFQVYDPGLMLANPKSKSTAVADKAFELLQRSTGGQEPIPGDEVIFPGGRIRVVWSAAAVPAAENQETEDKEENNRSVGVQLAFPGFGFLSLGDLECRSELAVSGGPLLTRTSILKVSHHGSKTASCPEFVAKISPEIAIISSGQGNKYGHPAAETLETLARYGVYTLRTDQAGTWEINRVEKRWLLRSERSSKKEP